MPSSTASAGRRQTSTSRCSGNSRPIAEAICADRALPLLTVGLDRLRESEIAPAESLGRIVREAALCGAAIFWQGAGALLSEQPGGTGGELIGAWRAALLGALDDQQAINLLLEQLRKTRTNIEFLMQVAKTTPLSDDD